MSALALIKRSICTVVLCLAPSAGALPTFVSELEPVEPTPGNTWYAATASFELDGGVLDFHIRFGNEFVVPTDARLVGAGYEIAFDLGTPFIVIHSPGPWPDGYDGATNFFGAFDLPPALRDDFINGRTTLALLGSSAGDFSGRVIPLPGDMDADGDVDDADFSFLFAAFSGPGIGTADATADLDSDGDTDDADFGLAFAAFTGPSSSAVVPEPSGIALLAFVGGCLAFRRRA